MYLLAIYWSSINICSLRFSIIGIIFLRLANKLFYKSEIEGDRLLLLYNFLC